LSLERLVTDLSRHALTAIDRSTLGELLAAAELVRRDDTCITGWIRILTIDGLTIVQEETPGGEVLVRRVPSQEDAERLVEHRLASYERMWDRCGCRIDYFGGQDREGPGPERDASL